MDLQLSDLSDMPEFPMFCIRTKVCLGKGYLVLLGSQEKFNFCARKKNRSEHLESLSSPMCPTVLMHFATQKNHLQCKFIAGSASLSPGTSC